MIKNNSHNDNNLEAKYSYFLVHLGLQIYTARQIYFEKNDLVFKDVLPEYYEWRSIKVITVFLICLPHPQHRMVMLSPY